MAKIAEMQGFRRPGAGPVRGAIRTQSGSNSTTPIEWSGAIHSSACAFRQFGNKKGNIT